MSVLADPRIGSELFGYRVEELIAQGGMGVVYRAHDSRLNRKVALKLIAPEVAQDEGFRQRLLREAELAASLEHPNVVPVHGAGESDGQLYLAMRYVDGSDLRTVLGDEGALAPARALTLCAQVAEALDAAHALGLVHRDVKPSNVLVDSHEHVYLADFGLTRRATEESLWPDGGRTGGTPAYVAPEQIEGAAVDGRADVYSLGCLLYECLTGEPPFVRDSRLAVVWAHLEEQPPSASARNPALPDAIDAVLAKALAKRPEQRHASCAELVAEARAALGLAFALSRDRKYVLAAAVALVAAVLAVVLFLVQRGRAQDEALVANAHQLAAAAEANLRVDPERSILLALEAVETTRRENGTVLREAEQALHNALAASRTIATAQGAGGSVAFSPDGKRLLSEGMQGSAAIWDAATGRRLFDVGRRVRGVDLSADGALLATANRNGTATVRRAETGEVVRTIDVGGSLLSAELAPGGDVLATVTSDGRVQLWELPSARPRLGFQAWRGRVEVPPEADVMSFGPLGRTLAVAHLGGVSAAAGVWNAVSGDRILTVHAPDFAVHDVDLSPDGRMLAGAAASGNVYLWDATPRDLPGRLLAKMSGHRSNTFDVEFSRDGTRLATASGDGTAKVWEVTPHGARELINLAGHTSSVTSVSFSGDGLLLATGSRDGARVWDVSLAGARPLLSFPGPAAGSFNGDVAYGPRGRILAATSGSNGVVRIWHPATAKELVALKGHAGDVLGIDISPDGARIVTASTDRTTRVWDTRLGTQLFSFEGHERFVDAAQFSPDGSMIATASDDQTARIVDAASGKELRVLRGHRAPIVALDFSPDGTRLATGSRDGSAKLWDVASGREQLRLDPISQELTSVTFSPDGSEIATVGFDGTVRLWDASDGTTLRSWATNQGALFDVAFDPDGSRLATAGADGRIVFWDLAGEMLLAMPGHLEAVHRISLSPEGTHLASVGTSGGTLRVWPLQVDELIELARRRVTRTLTIDECRQYLHLDTCPPGGARLRTTARLEAQPLRAANTARAAESPSITITGTRLRRGLALGDDGVVRQADRSDIVEVNVKITGWKMYPGGERRTDGGHWDILVDGAYDSSSSDPRRSLTTRLADGRHSISVQLSTNDHARVAARSRAVSVTVGSKETTRRR